jgi:hypothetical protein
MGASASPFPEWVPTAVGVPATIFANFTTEGAANHYWANGLQYAGSSAWKTALSATYTRSTSATFTQSGVVQTALSGVMRFPTDVNGNALGIRLTGAQTELCLWNRDLTNAVWTATTATVAKDQTGADGGANAASSILATAGNATVLQSITSTSQNRITGAYVKRLTGTGTINITQDNATFTPITVTAAWTLFTIPNATTANPVLGFQIVTNGDKIAVDFVSHRAGAGIGFVADVIATTTVTASQVADSFSFPFAGGTAFTAMGKTNSLGIVNGVNAAILDSGQNAADIVLYVPASTPTGYRSLNQVNIIYAGIAGDVSGVHKVAVTGNNSTRSISADGAVPATDAHVLVGTSVTSMFLGTENNATSALFGNVSQIGLWAGISGANVQALSTLP